MDCLLSFADDFFLVQKVNKPTRNNNILDLIFTNNHQLMNNTSIICNSRLSDHYLVKFNLNYESDNSKSNSKGSSKDHYLTDLHQYNFWGGHLMSFGYVSNY